MNINEDQLNIIDLFKIFFIGLFAGVIIMKITIKSIVKVLVKIITKGPRFVIMFIPNLLDSFLDHVSGELTKKVLRKKDEK